MPRTKTKPTLKRRRDYRDDLTPMSYQGLTLKEIRKELEGLITDVQSRFLFADICELLKPRRIERIRRDHDARAVLAFAAFTGPEAGEQGEWDEIYKRTDDYLKVRMMDNMSIDPMVIELRNLLGGLRNHRKLQKDRLAGRMPTPPVTVPTLAAFVDRQCSVKDYRASSEARERMAFRAIYQFPAACGGEIPLDAITPEWCEDLRLWRADAVSKRTRQLEERALCWLLDQAVTRRLLVANPMRALDTLKVPRHRAAWLEPNEVVAILDAARALDADPHHCAFPYLEVVVAVFAYTGCRAREVWGLTPEDVGDVIRVRPNPFNRLKRETSERVIPLWPELRTILEPHLVLVDVMNSPTVFPWRGQSYPDVRKLLGRAVRAAGVRKRVTWHTFRHSYCAARIQTLDHGAPISLFTVAAELGHTDTNLIRTTYGHLLTDRRRLEVVAYRGTETSPGTAADPVDVRR